MRVCACACAFAFVCACVCCGIGLYSSYLCFPCCCFPRSFRCSSKHTTVILLAARNWLAACPVLIDSYLLSCICFKHTHLPLTRFINACCTVQIDLQELELSFTGCDKTVASRKATHSQADWWFLSFDVEYTPGIVSNHTRNLTVQSTFSERVCVCQYVCVLVCLSVCLSVCFCVSVCVCAHGGSLIVTPPPPTANFCQSNGYCNGGECTCTGDAQATYAAALCEQH